MTASGLIEIYQCFCDETRLRILNLLSQGPLCVCHLQELLDESQVKISKHLSYLKGKAVVDAARHQNWMIYFLPEVRSHELEANLKCLQDCVQTHAVFKADLRRLAKLKPELDWVGELECCVTKRRRKRTGSRSNPCSNC